MEKHAPTETATADIAAGDVLDMNGAQVTTPAATIDEESQAWNKSLLRKIDWHLMPMMCMSYMIQFLDKQTLSQSSIMGLIKDLHLVKTEFSWAGSIFYFGYLAFSYPASVLLVRFPIGKYLAVNFFVWGIILACHAATKSFAGIMIVRFFLGCAEASVSPGFSMMTGMWYRRNEQPLRHGLWFTGNSFATAIGGLLAYAIAHIHSGLAAWKWLYLIYAIITLVWSVVLFLYLPDHPSTAKFLTEAERVQAVERLRENKSGAVDHTFQWDQVREALCDYKIWILFFYQLANNIPNGALSTFNNIVLSGFGFNTLQTYLLAMPTGAVHAMFAVGSTSLAGKFKNCRCLLMAVCTFIALIGCLLIYVTGNQGSRLFGLFIFMGYVGAFPMSLSLVSSNVAGYTKKATVGAMMFVAYCTGNIIGPFLFFARESPKYHSGFLAMLICFASAIVLILILSVCLRLENAARDRKASSAATVDVTERKDGSSEDPYDENLTDGRNIHFRYVY